jgi:hypothetical protein
MSVDGGRPEMAGRPPTDAIDPERTSPAPKAIQLGPTLWYLQVWRLDVYSAATLSLGALDATARVH